MDKYIDMQTKSYRYLQVMSCIRHHFDMVKSYMNHLNYMLDQ